MYTKKLPERPRLYLLLDRSYLDEEGLLALCQVALDEGVRLLQYRDKLSGDEDFARTARRLRELCSPYGATLIINDRVDIAASLGLGLHVGQEDASPRVARDAIGPDAVLGVSTHSLEEARAAFAEPVDYVAVGPLFATGTKRGVAPVGLELLRAVAAEAGGMPLVGIGGVTPERARDVLRAGAQWIAVVSCVATAPQPAAVIRRLIEAGEACDDSREGS